jgi:ribose transport system ATP-binding protein
MKRQGVAVIYISHFLEEVHEICDRFTVIRDGEMISTGRVADTSIGGIIEDMVGRAVDELFPSNEHEMGDPILHVAGLKGRGIYPDQVSFTLRRGEILGIAGLVGAGRSETVRALFGLEPAEEGRVAIRGRDALRAAYIEPRTALRQGMDLLSEDRKEEGLALNLPMLFNLTLSDLLRYSRLGLLNLRRERADGAHWIRALDIRTDSVEQRADELSGGNQQKLCLARLLQQDNDILFLDEPTRGIDIGSKAEIYRLIHRLAERGKAVVMISSYLPELLGVCDTLGVMFKGRLSTVRPIQQWTETSIMRFATSGTWTEAP